MDFWISEWISGFQIGFLDFTVDFWISQWISGFHSGFLDFSLDFWISGFQFGFLPTVYEISFVTDPSDTPNRAISSLLLGSRVELHPLAHAQSASLNCVQRLSPKKGASDKNSLPEYSSLH